jgi:hypothetical protein
MYTSVATLVGTSAWMMILPIVLFLWRKKTGETKSTKNGRETIKQVSASGDWLYVGRDEDRTPFYLDTESLSLDSDNAVKVRMWVKYKPLKGSAAFLNADSFLQATGRSHEPFDHIRQRLEIDFVKNLARDLELVFHAPDGRIIDSVEYRAPEFRKILPGSLYELLKKTAEGAWSPDRFHTDPELRAKLQEKLKEINEAFEAFETAGE